MPETTQQQQQQQQHNNKVIRLFLGVLYEAQTLGVASHTSK